MPASSPILGTPAEQRAAQLAKITHRRDEAVLTAAAMDSLANLIENTECPVNSHRPTWLTVARRIRQDSASLVEQAHRGTERIEQLQRNIRAESTFGPSPFPVENSEATPTPGGFDWVLANGTKLELEQALINATSVSKDQQDAVRIRSLTQRLDEIDGVFQ